VIKIKHQFYKVIWPKRALRQNQLLSFSFILLSIRLDLAFLHYFIMVYMVMAQELARRAPHRTMTDRLEILGFFISTDFSCCLSNLKRL